jgi:hypothetical protein
LPALAQTAVGASSRWASQDKAVSVPRPLKLRTGFSVSILSVIEHPSTSPRAAHSYCGVSRNTGSIAVRARRMRSRSSRTIAADCIGAEPWDDQVKARLSDTPALDHLRLVIR